MTPTLMPEEAVQASHPLGVAAGEVVVDGDDVDALALERIQIGRQGRDERLAFARLHLGDLAAVQHHAADQLDVEVAHVEHAPARLADDRERLRQEVVERLAVGEARLELRGLATQLFVGEFLDLRLFSVDGGDLRAQALQVTLVLRADDLCQERIYNHQERKECIERLTTE